MVDGRITAFQQTVLDSYRARGRHDLPWRQFEASGALDPYKVFVSEMMLQQTQVPRVIPKFELFIGLFPTFEAVAQASLADVLKAWSGLGYNRRAQFLWRAAQIIAHDFAGRLPSTSATLASLPGIGPNTAGALLAYAYNQPVVFIETNIRTVFIHHFFNDSPQDVDDKVIADLVARALPDNPREWYWALMDYGTHLKRTVGSLNVLSKHYTKQSAFAGSRRQVRGHVLRTLRDEPKTLLVLRQEITDERLPDVISDLRREGLICQAGDYYKLAGA